MLNREQRRAQLKQLNKKFKGFDITSGVLEIPIKGKEETLKLDVMDFDVIFYLTEMCNNFKNMDEVYKEDFERANNAPDNSTKAFETMRVYKKVINDFGECIDNAFGEGTMLRIFDKRTPVPELLGEFIEDLMPIVQVLASYHMVENGGQNGENQSIQSVLSSSNVTKYSGDRFGNA